jgi:hypothetical protein
MSKKALIKEHSKSITHSTVGDIFADQLIKSTPTMVGWGAALAAFLRGLPVWQIILIGSATFMLLSAALYFISARRMLGHNSQEVLPEDPQPDAPDYECPAKWLHELAEQDKRFIDQRVVLVSHELFRHDLLKELYVDFKFSILNASVYSIGIDEDSLKGDIYFNMRLLSKRNKLMENEARHCRHADTKDFVIRQWLEKEEIAEILQSSNDSDEFRFNHLGITIRGSSKEDGVNPKKLNVYGRGFPANPLRELYRKLKMNIISANFNSFYPREIFTERGLRVNVNVMMTNPRPVSIHIQSFKLVTTIKGKEYTAFAKTGDIREGEIRSWESGEIEFEGKPLANLNVERDSLLTLEPNASVDGWLQFDIQDVGYEEPSELPSTLLVIDSRDDIHHANCVLMYKNN